MPQTSPRRRQTNPLSLWAQNVDTQVLEQLLVLTRQGNTAEAAAAIARLGNGQPATVLLDHLQSLSNQQPEREAYIHQDYEFSSIELVRPTRMNKVGAGRMQGCMQGSDLASSQCPILNAFIVASMCKALAL